MTRRRLILIAGVTLLLAVVVVSITQLLRIRDGRRTIAELRSTIVDLTAERDRLRPHVIGAMRLDPRLLNMPVRELRVGIPTALAEHLVETLVAGIPDHLSLQLGGFVIERSGDVRRIVPLGDYHLTVRITRISARFSTGTPDIRFGDNRVSLTLPVRVASGNGTAAIDFRWDGRTVGGAVCGDMHLKERVSGTVRPSTYRVAGTLGLSTTADAIVLTPRFPPLRIDVHVSPTKASWDMVQKVLDSKGGLCGFVLDRVDIRGALEDLLARGFEVRVPTERIQPVALPIGIASEVTIKGVPVQFGGTAGSLSITDGTIWVGANVTVTTPLPSTIRKLP